MATAARPSTSELPERRPRPRPRGLRPFRSREALIAAAREVFKRQPWQIASMDEIAIEAGLSRRTLYNQFATAEDLFRATRDDLILEVAKIVPLSVSGRFSHQAALRTYCSSLAEAFTYPSFKELLTSVLRDGDSAPWFLDAYNRHVRIPIAQCLEIYIQAMRPSVATGYSASEREALNLLASIEGLALSTGSLPGFDRLMPDISNCTADFVDGFLGRVGRQAA